MCNSGGIESSGVSQHTGNAFPFARVKLVEYGSGGGQRKGTAEAEEQLPPVTIRDTLFGPHSQYLRQFVGIALLDFLNKRLDCWP